MASTFENAEVRRLTQPYEKIGVNNTFKSALHGFDKEAVLFYIDNLRKETAQQQRTFTSEIDRLYTRNNELVRNLANCEKEIDLLKKQLVAEREKQTVLTDEGDILHSLVTKLQSRIDELQGQLEAQKTLEEQLNQQLFSAGNELEQYKRAAEAANQQAQNSLSGLNSANLRASQLYNQVNYLNSQAAAREQEFSERAKRYEQTINYFRSNYENANFENSRLKSLNPEQLSEQNQSLNAAVSQLQQRVYRLQSELGAQNDYVGRLINQLNNARNTVASTTPAYINSAYRPQNVAPAQYAPAYQPQAGYQQQPSYQQSPPAYQQQQAYRQPQAAPVQYQNPVHPFGGYYGNK